MAEDLSFTRAAQRLGIAQPGLSAQIRRLEDRVGFPLFSRGTRRVELTDGGRAFLDSARAMVRTAQQAEDFVQLIRRGYSSRLVLGALSSTIKIPARVDLVETYRRAYPRIEIIVRNGLTLSLLRKLRSAEIDAALVVGPFDTNGLDVLPFNRVPRDLLIPTEDALAKLSEVPLEALRGRRVAVPPRELNPERHDELYKPLIQNAVELVPVPEIQKDAMLRFVQKERLILLNWGWSVPGGPRGMVQRPIAKSPIVTELYLTRCVGNSNFPLARFWEMAMQAVGR